MNIYNKIRIFQDRIIYQIISGDDSSRELLITSDSSNPYRRNYTRRPSPSRLTPYKRPIVNGARLPYNNDVQKNTTDEKTKLEEIKPTFNKNDSKVQKQGSKVDSSEDMVLGDINFFNDFQRDINNEEQADKRRALNLSPGKKQGSTEHGRAPAPLSPYEFKSQRLTRLEKNINKFERVIDGAELMKKVSLIKITNYVVHIYIYTHIYLC